MEHRGIIKPLGAVAVLYLYRYIDFEQHVTQYGT